MSRPSIAISFSASPTSLPSAPAGEPVPLIINGRYLRRRTTGVERVARGIVGTIESRLDDDGLLRVGDMAFRPRVEAPAGILMQPPSRLPVHVGSRFSGHAWEQIELPWRARDGLLLNLCNTAPMAAAHQVTYVHDAGVYAVSDAYGWRFRNWYKALYRAYRLRGDTLLTNSVFSARELQHYARLPRERLNVAAPGCDHVRNIPLAPMPLEVDRLARTRGYFLVIASNARHKNLGTALAAHAAFLRQHPDGPALVVVGARHDVVFRAAGADGAKTRDLLQLGYVGDPVMIAMLRRATALVFPSRYEGFGLPLAEAMAVGCPVIASDLPAAQEIGIDACWTFPPRDIDALVDRLAHVSTHPHEVQEKVRIGRQRASVLTWERCTDVVLDTARRACAVQRAVPA